MSGFYWQGHVNLEEHGYTTEYQSFDYVRQPIKESEIETWQSQGYTHDNWSGVMYDSTNPMPLWVRSVGKAIYGHLEGDCGYVLYCMKTGEIMPRHIDHYETYSRVFGINRDNIVRTLMFLEDWSPGHYFDIGNSTNMPWHAGDYWQWSADVPHSASNIGIKNRWTLQITGPKEG